MKIYNYDKISGEYIGEGFARLSPLEPGQFLKPANSTEIEPPEQMPGKIRIFDIDNNEWKQVSIEFITAETPIELTIEEKLDIIRTERNRLLYMCDWTQLNDSPLSIAKISEWATYRQKLRDFPETVDLDNIIWPIQP